MLPTHMLPSTFLSFCRPVCLGAVFLFAQLTSPAVAQPNILLIVSEDNGPELGCYGDPYARTPNLDQLAAEGIRFSRAFVPQAGCSQSRASILTGQIGRASCRDRV